MGILQKTFGGLGWSAYLTGLFLAMIPAGIFVALLNSSDSSQLDNPFMYVYIAISVLLYPYAAFVYASIVDFIMGDDAFVINVFVYFAWQIMIMMLLFIFAIFIAPIGLLYLWYDNTH